jgi:Tfp pilus assembly protein PilO
MTRLFDKLNLTKQERRILVAVALAVFVVLNSFFIWPQLMDWEKYKRQFATSQKTLSTYQTEIAQVSANQAKLLQLERQGSAVLPAEQALMLMRAVQQKADQVKLLITGTRTIAGQTTSTNQYFDEQAVSIDTSGGDQELVDFLAALGAGESMIRVRSLDLKPDPPLTKLVGKVELVASYQKKPKVAPATPPPARTASASVTNSATPTNATANIKKP